MSLDRREFLAFAAGFGVLVTGFGGAILPALAQDVDLAALNDPGALGDKVLGSETAPVTVIEYASMTCGHCQNFHAKTWPAFKEKYVDTGKVKFIFREFPLDPLAAAGIMLAHCAPEDRFYPIVDLLFEHQREWAFVSDPVNALFNLVKQAGFTQDSFRACLTNQQLLDGVNSERDRAANEFGVTSTPTFFINGTKHSGDMPIEEFDRILGPLLQNAG